MALDPGNAPQTSFDFLLDLRGVLICGTVDLAQWRSSIRPKHRPMRRPCPQKPVKKPKPSRLEEARRIVEEYTKDLREVIKKLARKLH